MKYLYLMRHAKSSWKFPELHDHDRPLNKRGKKDAPLMGNVLRGMKLQPDLILSSTAVRALTTAKTIAAALDYSKHNIVADPRIYDGGMDTLLKKVQSLDNIYDHVMMFGHNPDFTEFAEYLGDRSFDNIPTAGIAGLQFDVAGWAQIEPGTGRVVFYEYPKKHK